MPTFQDYKKAVDILELPAEFTFLELKKQYKNSIKENHPDKNKEKDVDLNEIKSAYKILKEYIFNYKVSFKKEEFKYLAKDIFEEKLKNDWEV